MAVLQTFLAGAFRLLWRPHPECFGHKIAAFRDLAAKYAHEFIRCGKKSSELRLHSFTLKGLHRPENRVPKKSSWAGSGFQVWPKKSSWAGSGFQVWPKKSSWAGSGFQVWSKKSSWAGSRFQVWHKKSSWAGSGFQVWPRRYPVSGRGCIIPIKQTC